MLPSTHFFLGSYYCKLMVDMGSWLRSYSIYQDERRDFTTWPRNKKNLGALNFGVGNASMYILYDPLFLEPQSHLG